jgi:hypothetical protein
MILAKILCNHFVGANIYSLPVNNITSLRSSAVACRDMGKTMAAALMSLGHSFCTLFGCTRKNHMGKNWKKDVKPG